MLVTYNLTPRQLTTYRKAFAQNNITRKKYEELYDYVNKNIEYKKLAAKKQDELKAMLKNATRLYRKACSHYIEICKKYDILPGIIL